MTYKTAFPFKVFRLQLSLSGAGFADMIAMRGRQKRRISAGDRCFDRFPAYNPDAREIDFVTLETRRHSTMPLADILEQGDRNGR